MRAKQSSKRSSRAPPRQLSDVSSIASSLAGASMDRKSPSSPAAASMAALAAAAAAGQSSYGQLLANGALSPKREEQGKKPAMLAAVCGAGSSSSPPVAARTIAASSGGPSCQVERCAADLHDARRYYRRHKVCEAHSKALVVLVAGLRQRFCQQCSRFHELLEFDDSKHSCRRRLAGHNERRRKSSADRHGSGGGGHQNGRSHPTGNPSRNHTSRSDKHI